MLSALEDKARIYYGGDLQFHGGNGLVQPLSNIDLLKDFFPEGSIIAERYDFDAEYAAFYFAYCVLRLSFFRRHISLTKKGILLASTSICLAHKPKMLY